VRNKREEIDWDLKFVMDWMAASIAKHDEIVYYVQGECEKMDIEILVKEVKEYTVNDIIGVLEEWFKFRVRDKGKLRLMGFFKDFVV
jgi:hypothetical protein